MSDDEQRDPAAEPLTICGQKRRGRPRRPTPATAVTTWLDVEQVDQLADVARVSRRSMSGVVRVAVGRFLADWQRRQS